MKLKQDQLLQRREQIARLEQTRDQCALERKGQGRDARPLRRPVFRRYPAHTLARAESP